MNTTESVSGFLDIDAEKHLSRGRNEPMPAALMHAKPGDQFTVKLRATIKSTEVNTKTGMVDRVSFYFDGVEAITKYV